MAQVVGYSEISISEYADGAGLYDSIPYYLASSQSEGVTIYDEGWSREVPVLTPEKKYLWIYYVSRYSAGTTEPELLTVYGNPAVVEYEGDDAPADKVLVEIEPDIAQGMDQTPYVYRAVSDSSVTDLKNHEIISEITGGTVAWNQLARYISVGTSNGVTIKNNGDGSISITGASSGSANMYCYLATDVPTGHVYFVKRAEGNNIGGGGASGGYNYFCKYSSSSSSFTKIVEKDKIIKPSASSDDTWEFRIQVGCDSSITYNDTLKPQLFDLTQMFGTDIADYIYSLETATAGAGVSLFKSLFQKDYYAYNAGELLSVKTSARETTGKNLLAPYTRSDSSASGVTWSYQGDSFTARGTATGTSYASLIGLNWQTVEESIFGNLLGKQITISGGKDGIYMNLAFRRNSSDSGYQTNWVTNGTITVPTDGSYQVYFNARVTSGWSGEATIRPQVELGSTATDYEPYEHHTYPLSNIELRGIPKLASNKLTYDGDIYKADGSVTRRFKLVTLDGSATPQGVSSTYAGSFIFNSSSSAFSGVDFTKPIFCNKLVYQGMYTTNFSVGGCINANGTSFNFWVKDTAFANVNEAKTWLQSNPLTVLCQLSSPTTETTNPYTEIQIGDADGTEEFIDDRAVAVPVGHKTSYIQAYDDIHMEHWGKNWLDPEKGLLGYILADGTFAPQTGNSATNLGFYKMWRLQAGHPYTISVNASIYNIGTCLYKLDGTVIQRANHNNTSSFTIASSTEDRLLSVWIDKNVTSYGTLDNAIDIVSQLEPQLEAGNARTEYVEPYHESLTFSLGEPVYGGTVDVANYKTTKKYGIVDLGTLAWTVNTAGADGKIRMQTTSSDIPDMKNYSRWSYTHILCSRYPARNINVSPYIDKSIGQYNNRVLVYDSDYTDAATFKAAMDGVYLIYELAEPETDTFQP